MTSAFDTGKGLTAPRAGLQIDEQRLFAYLKANVPSIAQAQASSFEVLQFTHGQSNPTYLLKLGIGNTQAKFVLRKKPPGKLLASAHAVDREHAVLQALSLTPVPVPKPIIYCNDPQVIGTEFYVMDFADGRIFLDPNLPDLTPDQRRHVYKQMGSTLAALHEVQPDAVGLTRCGP